MLSTRSGGELLTGGLCGKAVTVTNWLSGGYAVHGAELLEVV